MPIKIPADLPACQALERENIFIMTEDRALAQDIRPLDIAIVNLMPTKIATETQLLRLLGNTPLQVNITFLRTADHTSKNTSPAHLTRFYTTFKDIGERTFDGMIITGAPVEHLAFEDVDYWQELQGIMDYASLNVHSTLFICWGAQAALYHYYGVPKYVLPQKLSGIFEHRILQNSCRLFRGFDDVFYSPHSRHTEIRREDVANVSGLDVLAASEEAGITVLSARQGNQVFVTGHLEYDPHTLDGEYRRDVNKGLNPAVPQNYYDNNNPQCAPVVRWRAHAHLLFSNWLNYYVYQETPYNIENIRKDTGYESAF